MPVSPADFALWARATGNKYPETAEEKLAAAPHAYSYAKNLGKIGPEVQTSRVGGRIFYDQPESVQNTNPDSLFNAPVTPDNHVAKVSGTASPTLTSEHFLDEEAHETAERHRDSSLISTIGKTALAAGTIAAGIAMARHPAVQQAAHSAGSTIKENAGDIGHRVSSFLGGFGGGRYADPDVVRNSGDVTPPTTAQRFGQEQVPTATKEIQIAKGAPTGSAAESTLHTKPVTESELITSSQTFGPKQYEGGAQALRDLETAQPSSPELKTARAKAATEDLLSIARARKGEVYQPEIPGVKGTLMALRSPLANVDLEKNIDLNTGESLGLVQPSAETPIGPSTKTVNQLELNLGEQTSNIGSSAFTESAPSTLSGRVANFITAARGVPETTSVNTEPRPTFIIDSKSPHPLGRALSPLNVRLSSGETIEEAYQKAKGYPTVFGPAGGKGKPALTPGFDYEGVYQSLYNRYAQENPGVMAQLSEVAKTHDLAHPRARTTQNPAVSLTRILQSPLGTESASEQTSNIGSAEPVTYEESPAQTFLSAKIGRQRPVREVSPEHMKAYDIVAAGAERGHKIEFERALEIATNPSAELTFGEQQAFETPRERIIAIGKHQSFDPEGYAPTGKMMSVRTGEEAGQRAVGLAERYREQNVAGLTPGVRRSAGAQRLREKPEQDEPAAVLSTPTGRPMRGLQALDLESLAQGEEVYSPKSAEHVTGTTEPEQLAKTIASATGPGKMQQMNSLFGPESSSTMVHLKTEAGLRPMGINEFRKGTIGKVAKDVFRRAAAYHANKQGVELPSEVDDYPGYLTSANQVLYGSNEVMSETIPQMATAFDQGLRQYGIKLAATANPREKDLSAVHTLMGVARGTTTGQLSLEHFSKLAGRARSQGLVRTPSTMVPSYITMRPPGV